MLCVYAKLTLSADGNFVIDRHPTHPSLIVAVGGSGLGVMTMPMIVRCM